VLVRDADGQHCAPSELSILRQLEAAVIVPNYNRLVPSGRTFLNLFNTANCYCFKTSLIDGGAKLTSNGTINNVIRRSVYT
jgi:hypothetical protein